jgi:hypothetical protein
MCPPYSETKQGIEIQFNTNYLSHHLLTRILLHTLLSTSSPTATPPIIPRMVNISSDGHSKLVSTFSPSDLGFPNLKESSTWARYGTSKLCQVLHSKSLSTHYPGILTLSLHPGTLKTGLSAGLRESTAWYKFMQPLVELGALVLEEGCANIVFCAVSDKIGIGDNGAYFLTVGKRMKASKFGEDPELAEELQNGSERRLRELGYRVPPLVEVKRCLGGFSFRTTLCRLRKCVRTLHALRSRNYQELLLSSASKGFRLASSFYLSVLFPN